MFHRGEKRKGKLLERGFHGFGAKIREEVLKRTILGVQTILDIGTGSGRNLRLLAGILKDTRIFSIDPSLKALEAVKGMLRVEYLEEQVGLVGGVGESIPFKDRSYGLIFSVMSLHHISNIEDVLMEVVRVLKDDGKLIVVDWTPSASRLMNQPPSHFLSVDVFKRTVDALGFSYQIEEFSTWYISEVIKI